ncbi:conserved hypothetical protein [Ricinus communis]|uniref:Uncharacterized protein n=1 Tax=Ricinus communis TaxID=3988 RepID=B9T6Q7_RICCO|nr:conserved hypothetical protein [Ricinus communis]
MVKAGVSAEAMVVSAEVTKALLRRCSEQMKMVTAISPLRSGSKPSAPSGANMTCLEPSHDTKSILKATIPP